MSRSTLATLLLTLLFAISLLSVALPSAHAVEIVIQPPEEAPNGQDVDTTTKSATTPTNDATTPPTDTPDDASATPAETVRFVPLALRIPAEVGGGLVAGVGVFLVGVGAAFAMGDESGYGALALGLLGGWAAVPIGVWATGEWLGGDGSLGWTYLGMVAGSLAAGAITDGMANDGNETLYLIAWTALLVAGPIIAYEWSNDNYDAPRSVALVPTLAVTPEAATAGVAFVF